MSKITQTHITKQLCAILRKEADFIVGVSKRKTKSRHMLDWLCLWYLLLQPVPKWTCVSVPYVYKISSTVVLLSLRALDYRRGFFTSNFVHVVPLKVERWELNFIPERLPVMFVILVSRASHWFYYYCPKSSQREEIQRADGKQSGGGSYVWSSNDYIFQLDFRVHEEIQMNQLDAWCWSWIIIISTSSSALLISG